MWAVCKECYKEQDVKDAYLKLKTKGWRIVGRVKGMAPAGRKEIWICGDCIENELQKKRS